MNDNYTKICSVIYNSGVDRDIGIELTSWCNAIFSSYDDFTAFVDTRRPKHEKLSNVGRYSEIIKLIHQADIDTVEKFGMTYTFTSRAVPFEDVDIFNLSEDEKKEISKNFDHSQIPLNENNIGCFSENDLS